MAGEYWEGKEYSYFSHKDCEFFPCHKGADPQDFNCLFCYCPLYALGDKCGGNFRYTEKGLKDCTGCLLPHKHRNYGYVTGKYQELAKLMAEIRDMKADNKDNR
nr:cysteine-rich small domain-containing protein [uncultured Blautia sp.]